MRELTMDEMSAVSGGFTAADNEMIVVQGFRFDIGGGASLGFGTSASTAGLGSFFGVDLPSLSTLGESIKNWLIELGIFEESERDPNEIVVTAKLPPEQFLGNGFSIREFPGPDALYYNSEFVANVITTPKGQNPDYHFHVQNPNVEVGASAKMVEGNGSISPNSYVERNFTVVEP